MGETFNLIKKPHEIEPITTIRMLIYGQPGIGKSTLALSTPDALLLDFDHGAHRIKLQHLHDTVQVKGWSDVLAVINHLTANPKQYRTIIVDTAGKMLDYMSDHIIRMDPKMGQRDGSLHLKGWGARKVMFQRFVATLSLLEKNLVFTAHEKEEKDGDVKIIRPEMGGSSANDLIKELDLVGYMEAHGKKRTISFTPTERFYGKNTCDIDDVVQIPNTESKADNNFLDEILKRYEVIIKERGDIMIKYKNLLDSFALAITMTIDADTANEFISFINKSEHIWDSKQKAGIMIRDKAKELNLLLDKETKTYISLAPKDTESTDFCDKDEVGHIFVPPTSVDHNNGEAHY